MKPLALAQLIVPEHESNGDFLGDAQQFVKRQLLNEFGGFTSWPVDGAWRNPSGADFFDESILYQVGFDSTVPANYERIRQIAIEAGQMLKQEAVCVNWLQNGLCEIIDC